MQANEKKDIYTSFYLGYAGSAKLYFDEEGKYINNFNKIYTIQDFSEEGWTMLSLTNAVYTRKLNIPKTSSFYLPYSNSISSSDAKSQIRLGFGVYDFNGSITFELTDKIIETIWKQSFFSRKGLFHLVLNDGMNKLTIPNCAWSNITLDATPHSILSMSISFLSDNGKSNALIITDVQSKSNSDSFSESDDLVRYWETGVSELGTLESFNLSFSRNVTPVYHNNSFYTPTYLKVGRTDVTASLTCMDYYGDDKFEYDKQSNSSNSAEGAGIKIWVNENHYIKFRQNVFSSQTYNISGLSQIGTKVYEINSLSKDITKNIFTIGKVQTGG